MTNHGRFPVRIGIRFTRRPQIRLRRADHGHPISERYKHYTQKTSSFLRQYFLT